MITEPAANRRERNWRRGMVTVELAIGMLVAGSLAVTFSWAVSLIGLQSRCADAAGQIARQVARGDLPAQQIAQAQLPAGAQLSINKTDDIIEVQVSVQSSLGRIGAVTVSGEATALNGGR